MESILYNISQVLGITVIHSLWQGLLLWTILRIAFITVPSLSPVKKYNLSVAAIASIFICFVYTLYAEVLVYNWAGLRSVTALPLLPYLNPVRAVQNQSFYNTIAGYLPYISALYIAGLTVNLVKLSGQWNKIRMIKQSAFPAGQMQQFINTFSKKLDITKHIRIKFSDLIDVPCMIGYFKPIILLPVSIATYLSACEIEAILLHELSHIKRNDYLVNLLQQFINVMLFFNPFALLISRTINQERENSCDDMVIGKTQQPLIYAHALLRLEENRVNNLQLALSATGKKYNLLNRIERIMKTKKPIGHTRQLLTAVLLLAGGLCSIAWLNPKAAYANTAGGNKAIVKTIADKPLVIAKTDSNKNILVNDTIKHHHKSRMVIIDKNGNKRVYNGGTDSTTFDSLDNFYSTAEWRKQMETIRKQGEEMKKQFDKPAWKAQMLVMQKQGEEMKKHFNSPEWKAQMDAMKLQGEQMKKQFNSPEWKAKMDAMKLQGEQMKKQFDSPEWKAKMDAMKLQGEQMKKQFDNPEWKAQMENMRKQGEEIKKHFNSPEWKAQMENMKLLGERMKKQFNSPEWKAQMENMGKQGEEIKKHFNSPEWKAQMENMKLLGERMKKQFNSPEWKAQMENMGKQFNGAWMYNPKDSLSVSRDTVGK